MKIRITAATLFIFVVLTPLAQATDFSSTNFTVKDPVIEELSSFSTSTNFQVRGTIPYISATPSTSTNFGVNPGFEAFPAATPAATSSDDDAGGGGGGGGGDDDEEEVYPPVMPVTPIAPIIPIAPILGPIIDIVGPIFFPPAQPPALVIVPLEKLVPKIPQLSLRGLWDLIPPEPLRELVFRPLPLEITRLAGSFPQIDKLFSEVGITRFNDLQKLRNISLSVPGLTDVLALQGVGIEGGKPGTIRDLQLTELTPDLKKKLPSGVVFAKLAGGKLDAHPILRLTDQGRSEQVIRVVSGREMTLAIKPEVAAKSVKGYLLFKSRAIRPLTQSAEPSVLDELLGVKKAQAQETPETAFILSEFEYVDTDNDGIYTATIAAPLVSGEYEVVTIIEYVDPDYGTRAVRMVTVVDPEGYVYELAGGKEVRIPGAIVTLEWLNRETSEYQLWPATEYQQTNPQITTVTGEYSFLVPPGYYRLVVSAPGYTTFEGKPFEVVEGRGVHENIEMRTRFWFLNVLDWKSAALLLISLLLLYNFYRDKMRERREAKLAANH